MDAFVADGDTDPVGVSEPIISVSSNVWDVVSAVEVPFGVIVRVCITAVRVKRSAAVVEVPE